MGGAPVAAQAPRVHHAGVIGRVFDAEILDALHRYRGAVVLVTHDEGAVRALAPERVVLLPDGDEDLWTTDYLELVALA